MAKKSKHKLEDSPFFVVTDTRSARKIKNDAKKLQKIESEQEKELTKQEKDMIKKFNLLGLNITESDKQHVFDLITKPLNEGKLIFHHYSCGVHYYKKV